MTAQAQFGDGLLEKIVVDRQVRVVAAVTLAAENEVMGGFRLQDRYLLELAMALETDFQL
jgi:hypothetical protein